MHFAQKSNFKFVHYSDLHTAITMRYDKGTTKKAADQGKEENTMTNEQIILNESINLMEQGKLNGTGNMITIITVNSDGQEEKKQIEEPEPIHTYAAWKQLGFQVKKVVRQSHRSTYGSTFHGKKKSKLNIQTEPQEPKKLIIPKCL